MGVMPPGSSAATCSPQTPRRARSIPCRRRSGWQAFHQEPHRKGRSVSTRIERDDDTLIAVLNDAHFDFAFEPSDIATLWTSVAPHLMVTGRTRPLRSVDALRTAVRSGNAPCSSVALLAELMRTQASGLVDIVRGVTQRIDDVEDA